MAVSKDQPMRPAEVALLEISDMFSNPASYEKSGEIIETDNAADYPLLSLTIHGKSVQDGTPTPDAPVEVQVVGSYNDLDMTAYSYDNVRCDSSNTNESGVTVTCTDTGYMFRQTRTPITGFVIGQQYTLTATMSNSTFNAMLISRQGGGTQHQAGTTFTATQDTYYLRFYKSNAVAGDTCTYTGVGINKGSGNAYVPRGCIGLQIGESITPIDLQGHELASLPDGTRDVLRVDSAGTQVIEQQILAYTITGTEQLQGFAQMTNVARGYFRVPGLIARVSGVGNDKGLCTHAPYKRAYWDDDIHVYAHPYADGTEIYIYGVAQTQSELLGLYVGATVYCGLATPQTIELGTITPPTPIDGGTVRIVANVTPTIDVSYMASGMRGGILALNNCAADLAALDVRVTALENELDNF